MKFGILSDLHLGFDKSPSGQEFQFTPEPGVFYLNPGDIADGPSAYNIFSQTHDEYMFSVMGNHDHYYAEFFVSAPKLRIVNGLTIAGATLWTEMHNWEDWYIYTRSLVDARLTPNLTYDLYRDAHQKHKNFIFDVQPDIVVTHHAPTLRSIHERYKNDICNKFFCNDLENAILHMPNPPKLWVHGHVHDAFDYMVGNTRVVANPRGYPREANYKNYAPKIVEL